MAAASRAGALLRTAREGCIKCTDVCVDGSCEIQWLRDVHGTYAINQSLGNAYVMYGKVGVCGWQGRNARGSLC